MGLAWSGQKVVGGHGVGSEAEVCFRIMQGWCSWQAHFCFAELLAGCMHYKVCKSIVQHALVARRLPHLTPGVAAPMLCCAVLQ